MSAEAALEHHRRHPRSFLDVADSPDGTGLAARFWCIECHEEIDLSEEQADALADEGLPWRTGTE